MPFRLLPLTVLTLLLLANSPAFAQPPSCIRSALLMVCEDGLGNAYSVRSEGADTFLRGFANASGRSWAQTNTRYGQLTLFTGIASDGEVWTGRIQKIGWTTLSRFSSSRTGSQRVRCNRMSGCAAEPVKQAGAQ